MGQINLSGILLAGPAANSDQAFPSGTTTIPIVTTPNPKTYANDTGRNNTTLNSPNAYVALGGLGASAQPVSQATLLYIRTPTQMLVRLTFGSTVLADIPIQGVFLMEFPTGTPCVLVEMKGSGPVEYYFAGTQ